jgi:hypothetical protein
MSQPRCTEPRYHVKRVSSFNGDAKKFRLDSGKRFSTNIHLRSHQRTTADDTSVDTHPSILTSLPTSIYKEDKIWLKIEGAYTRIPSSGYVVPIYVFAFKLLHLFTV